MDVRITLQGRGDGVGQFEVPTDSGADSCAVQGASTFMRPEWTTGLRTHSQTTERTQPHTKEWTQSHTGERTRSHTKDKG